MHRDRAKSGLLARIQFPESISWTSADSKPVRNRVLGNPSRSSWQTRVRRVNHHICVESDHAISIVAHSGPVLFREQERTSIPRPQWSPLPACSPWDGPDGSNVFEPAADGFGERSLVLLGHLLGPVKRLIRNLDLRLNHDGTTPSWHLNVKEKDGLSEQPAKLRVSKCGNAERSAEKTCEAERCRAEKYGAAKCRTEKWHRMS